MLLTSIALAEGTPGIDTPLSAIVESWARRSEDIRNASFLIDEYLVIPQGSERMGDDDKDPVPMPPADVQMATRREIIFDIQGGRYLRKHSYPIWNDHYQAHRLAYQEVFCDGKQLRLYRPTDRNSDSNMPRSEFQPEIVEPAKDVSLKSVLDFGELPVWMYLGLWLDRDTQWFSPQHPNRRFQADVFAEANPPGSTVTADFPYYINVERADKESPFIKYGVTPIAPYPIRTVEERFKALSKQLQIEYDVDHVPTKWSRSDTKANKPTLTGTYNVISVKINQTLDESIWLLQPRRELWIRQGQDFFRQQEDGTRIGPTAPSELRSK
ncbi:hypothetical protein [Lacipirellula limnantheis]|uniref:hypothetical protein n=1 Tax=Lacipirellula limnantheis TaxID=2528024 RepID=UPI00119DF6C0|nr:hypothetical protein [Lacipirellula limnantheis]